MNYIRITDTESVYPYSFGKLREDHPNVSFSGKPSAEDLAYFGVFVVNPTPLPSHDARTERVLEVAPVNTGEGKWEQAWEVRPATEEEISIYDLANSPAPDWGTFKTTALNSSTLNSILVEAFSIVPVASSALAPALLRCETGDYKDFEGSWATICGALEVPVDAIQAFVDVAKSCHLPDAFIKTLQLGS